MRSVSNRSIQAKVDSYMQERYEQIEYEAAIEHAPEIMRQTAAMFLLSLKWNGFGPKRLKEAYDNFLAVLDMPAELLGTKISTVDIEEFLTKTYDIDFSQIQPKFPSYKDAKKKHEQAT